jgi:hypothetical protein
MTEAARPQPEQNAVPGALPDTQPAALPGSQAETPLPTLAIQPPAQSSGMAEDWAKVGAAALAILAPQVALPAGAIGAAATVFQMLRRRRQQMQTQQPQRQTIVERPIPVAMPAAPQPAQVVTQNEYVPIDTDTTADALAWATKQLVKQYPGTEGTVAMLDKLIEQHRAASGGRNGNK